MPSYPVTEPQERLNHPGQWTKCPHEDCGAWTELDPDVWKYDAVQTSQQCQYCERLYFVSKPRKYA